MTNAIHSHSSSCAGHSIPIYDPKLKNHSIKVSSSTCWSPKLVDKVSGASLVKKDDGFYLEIDREKCNESSIYVSCTDGQKDIPIPDAELTNYKKKCRLYSDYFVINQKHQKSIQDNLIEQLYRQYTEVFDRFQVMKKEAAEVFRLDYEKACAELPDEVTGGFDDFYNCTNPKPDFTIRTENKEVSILVHKFVLIRRAREDGYKALVPLIKNPEMTEFIIPNCLEKTADAFVEFLYKKGYDNYSVSLSHKEPEKQYRGIKNLYDLAMELQIEPLLKQCRPTIKERFMEETLATKSLSPEEVKKNFKEMLKNPSTTLQQLKDEYTRCLDSITESHNKLVSALDTVD